MYLKSTQILNPDQRFICADQDAQIYRCGSVGHQDESYWNTFSFLSATGRSVGQYYCNGEKWISHPADAINVCKILPKDNPAEKLNDCLNNPASTSVRLFPGIYVVESPQIAVRRSVPLEFSTYGIPASAPICSSAQNHECAELKLGNQANSNWGMLFVDAIGFNMHHLVINGNKQARWNGPAASRIRSNIADGGGTISMTVWKCDRCQFSKIISKNALGTSGFYMNKITNSVVSRNAFFDNGQFGIYPGSWADGATILNFDNSEFTDNLISNNTDVDLIFGGSRNSIISRNIITHDERPEQRSAAALMLHQWPASIVGELQTSGNYESTIISNNTVDCGAYRRCLFGIYLGSKAWYNSNSFGDANTIIKDNQIKNVMQGILADQAKTFRFQDNQINSVGGHYKLQSGLVSTGYIMQDPNNTNLISFINTALPGKNIGVEQAPWSGGLTFVEDSPGDYNIMPLEMFISTAYKFVLDRNILANEFDFWNKLIKNGTVSRNQFISELINSSEFAVNNYPRKSFIQQNFSNDIFKKEFATYRYKPATTCIESLTGTDYTVAIDHNSSVMSSGDRRFYCYYGNLYECAWELTDYRFAVKVSLGYQINGKTCNGATWD